MDEVDGETLEYLQHVSSSFAPLSYAFAYGSGMFKQHGHKSTKDNMLDFIFVVDDPTTWHKQNLRKHSHHYSGLKRLGANRIASIQNSYGAAIYFNTLVSFEDRLMKYGVIDTEHFLRDMIAWDTLYVSGRLHKPVVVITGTESQVMQDSVNRNLRSALETSLLLLPERFSEIELFTTITGLSYSGDVRMIVGEDKGKINNIVAPNLHKFKDLYSDVIHENRALSWNGGLAQDIDPKVRSRYVQRLPLTLRRHVASELGSITTSHSDLSVMDGDCCRSAVVNGLNRIVRKSSMSQTVKGVATAGLGKSVVYGLQKLKKMMKSMRR